ncbi:UDP-galactopyranose mutase [Brachyspira hyodysenteriae]|uniref:UDP-galactopyranose mutase n=1 Tax=Brachyspira hyodysenteriae TaxID=159 RepID=UPI00063DBA9B|nr:UDP-galactopyranose mutase [Brachyspira hyodysenteriae]KLI30814.1 UDP-galactopyranose mutase [Brachyspira hyodysenteriae]
MNYDCLVVGAGITGSCLANILANCYNKNVLLIDKRNHIAGNCYDYKNEIGITIHKYGAHIFHTNNKKVWDYLSKYTSWNYYFHKVKAVVEGSKVTIPFNLKTIEEIFPHNISNRIISKLLDKYEYGSKISILDFKENDDKDIKFIYQYVYKNIFENYTIKQWGISPNDIDASVISRVPIYISNDDRYFQDIYQGIPSNGYTKLIEKLIDHENIHINLNTNFSDIKNKDFQYIFYTGSIDDFFNYKYGILPYRSIYFENITINKEYYQETSVINYPNNYDFTRIIEHKHFLDEYSNKTIISIEYSEMFDINRNDRYYPIENDINRNLYNKYLTEINKLNNVYILGRLGDYKYYNMDNAVERVLNFMDNFKF